MKLFLSTWLFFILSLSTSAQVSGYLLKYIKAGTTDTNEYVKYDITSDHGADLQLCEAIS